MDVAIVFLLTLKLQDKNLLDKLPMVDRTRILDEMKYNILCTDLAVYFQLRAQLTPLVADHAFDWTDNIHRSMLKVRIIYEYIKIHKNISPISYGFRVPDVTLCI